MTSDWVLIDLEVKEPDTCKSRETWTLYSSLPSLTTIIAPHPGTGCYELFAPNFFT